MTPTLQTYRDMLRINRHALETELEVQADVLDRIHQQVVAMNSRVLAAADELKRTEANAFAECKSNGDSDKVAEINVRRSTMRQEAFKRHQAAREHHEEWSGLYEAWKARGFSMKELVALYSVQYFAPSTTGIPERPSIPRRDYTTSTPARRRAGS